MSASSSASSTSSSPSSFSGAPKGRALSQRKLEANRANSQKSTGPKSPQGKSRSSRNATTLGLYSSHNVLPCEDPALFMELRSAYLADLHPQTPIELLLVEQIISAAWKIRRLHAAEYQLHLAEHGHLHAAFEDAQQTYQKSKELHDSRVKFLGPDNVPPLPPPPPDLTNTPIPPGTTLAHMLSRNDECALDRLHLHEQRLQRLIHRALTQLRTLRKSRPTSDDLPQHPYLDEESRAELLNPDPQSPPQPQAPHQNQQNEPTDPPPSGVVASATTSSHPPQTQPEPTVPSPSEEFILSKHSLTPGFLTLPPILRGKT